MFILLRVLGIKENGNRLFGALVFVFVGFIHSHYLKRLLTNTSLLSFPLYFLRDC